MPGRHRLAALVFSLLLIAAGGMFLAFAEPPAAEGKSVFEIDGAIPKPGVLGIDDLKALGPASVEWTHKGETHSFTGMPVMKLLEARGFQPGGMVATAPKSEKRAGWKYAAVASASDGFQAVFSCAELHELIGNTNGWLVWEKDGQPLPADEGPFRLVIVNDKEGARCLFHLQRLTLVDMRTVVPPTKAGETP